MNGTREQRYFFIATVPNGDGWDAVIADKEIAGEARIDTMRKYYADLSRRRAAGGLTTQFNEVRSRGVGELHLNAKLIAARIPEIEQNGCKDDVEAFKTAQLRIQQRHEQMARTEQKLKMRT